MDYQAGIYLLRTETDIRRNVILGAMPVRGSPHRRSTLRWMRTATAAICCKNSLDKVWKNENLQRVDNKSAAVFGQANWHFTEDLTVTTGLRFTREDRTNPGSSLIFDNGNAPELNPYQVNGVSLGGFDTVASGNARHSRPTHRGFRARSGAGRGRQASWRRNISTSPLTRNSPTSSAARWPMPRRSGKRVWACVELLGAGGLQGHPGGLGAEPRATS